MTEVGACDIAVVGGGPAGVGAALMTARYDLVTVVFDRGPAALPRCAFLENYPGFPGGIGIEPFQELLRDHLDAVGADRREVLVETVERDAEEFILHTADGPPMRAASVIAASWYDASYLRGLDDPAMFEPVEADGEPTERFDPTYPDADGRTPVDGLYVASPCHERNAQAIIAAGHGAHVARMLIADRRERAGYPPAVVPYYDWLRRDREFQGEWGERERWRRWFDDQVEGDHAADEIHALRERYVERRFAARLTREEATDRERIGFGRLLACIPDAIIEDYLDGRG